GRLLEILEERVRRFLVHRVRAEDQVDAAVGLERPHVQVVPELADGVDPDLISEWLEHVEIGVRASLYTGSITQECGRKCRRHRADSSGSISSKKVRSGSLPEIAGRFSWSTCSTPSPRAPPW